ncbi:MAG: hypothetical protein M3322_05880 [Actinomycetota bacterium]|nr:hypothetical protein [Actinomycetota bacterium]
MSMASLLYVDDDTLDRVVSAPGGVLVLAKDDCENCAAYETEIRSLQERGVLGDLVIGKLVLTRPGCRRFKRENPWLSGVDFLPYTLLYAGGEKVDEFAASRGTYLLERAADAGLV